jgi:hypothetical protein
VEVKFVHYLHRLAGKHAETPPELTRKVWAGAADLLEERAYIRRELEHEVRMIQQALSQVNATGAGSDSAASAAAMQLQVDTARTLQEAVLLGDHLLSVEWMEAAAAVASQYASTLSEVEAQIRSLTLIQTQSATTESDGSLASSPSPATAVAPAVMEEPSLQNSEQVAMHATLRSVVAFVREALVESPQLYVETSSSAAPASSVDPVWQRQLQVAVRTIIDLGVHDAAGAYEALVQSAEALGALLGLLDQGANSSVF